MENHNNNNENLYKMKKGWNELNKSSDRNGTSSTNNVATGHSHHSTEEESDDDYYVYTYKYKGDGRENQLADLPSSFYKFDLKPTKCCQNNSTPNGEGGSSSGTLGPANGNNGTAHDLLEFLEMDFIDPDVNAEIDDEFDPIDTIGDVNDEDQLPSLAQQTCTLYPEENELEKRRKQSPVHSASCSSPIPSTSSSCCTNIPAVNFCSRLVSNNSEDDAVSTKVSTETSKDCNILDTVEVATTPGCSKNTSLLFQDNYQNSSTSSRKSANSVGMTLDSRTPLQRDNTGSQLTLRLVKSITLPEISSFTNNNLLPVARGSTLFSSEPLFDSERSYRAVINTSQSSKVTDEVELEVGRIMIWDTEEAKRMSISQIGPSACGATSVLNVLRALKIEKSPEFVNQCVGTRTRAENADLPQYLFSRSNAGATHVDLINGAQRASDDLVYARFFPVKKEITSQAFSKWLLYWICKGAIPIATRNLQIGQYRENEIPDAWHHQMIFGVCPQGIFMNQDSTGECVPVSELLPQLSSDSVLLIRRQDIINRKGPMTDLRQLARHPEDSRWSEMNVLGQVANILLEEIPIFNENNAARRVRSSHITIPAMYRAGITLFVRRESPSCQLLMTAPELSI